MVRPPADKSAASLQRAHTDTTSPLFAAIHNHIPPALAAEPDLLEPSLGFT